MKDNRGEKHYFSVVLLGVIVALYRCRYVNLFSIHRTLTNKQAELCQALNIPVTPVVYRAHLPNYFKKTDISLFPELYSLFFGVDLNPVVKKWFFLDGKELRVSILIEDKNGMP